MKVHETTLPGVLLIEPEVFRDERGFFLETYRAGRYEFAGAAFVQDNLSSSVQGVVRGLHLQWPRAQGKLVYVPEGEVFDVVVDLRRGSPTFRLWEGHVLSSENQMQVWIPPGFAHGFAATSERALLAYKCTDSYDPACELTVRWNDPALRIRWPIEEPSLSPKDAAAPLLEEIPEDRLPRF